MNKMIAYEPSYYNGELFEVNIVQKDDFLAPFIHSKNDLGTIYRIPKNINVNFDYDLIMNTYIHAKITETEEYHQVICIHDGAINRSIGYEVER